MPPVADIALQKVGGVAYRRQALIYDINTSHVPMLSDPEFTLDVIRQAAESI